MSDSPVQTLPQLPARAVAPSRQRFFSRRDKLAFGVAAAASFAGYFYTLAPSVTLEDSGEFLTAAYNLGVPHPPGYPIWTILAWLWQLIIPFGNIAWRVNLMSAFFGGLAVGLTALLISKGGHVMADKVGLLHRLESKKLVDLIVLVSSVSAALLLAFTPVMWSQAVIAEVYTLNAFFLLTILLLLYRWSFNPERRWLLYLAAFVWGVGLTNHQTLVLLTIAFPAYVWFVDRKFGRDTLIPILLVAVAGLWKMILGTNQTIDAVKHNAMAQGQPAQFAAYAPFYFPLLVLTALAIAGLVWLYFLSRRGGSQMLASTILLFGALAFLGGAVLFYKLGSDAGLALVLGMLGGDVPERIANSVGRDGLARRFVAVGVLLLAGGVAHGYFAWKREAEFLRTWRRVLALYGAVLLGLGLYLYMPVASATNPPMNWGYTRTPEGFVHHFTRGQYEKVRLERTSIQFWGQLNMFLDDLESQYNIVYALFPLLTLFFYRDFSRRDRDWLKFLFIGFLFLGLGFIFLSNPSFDKQKQFTDRVFFLPGHCLYALWIGYSLILGLGSLLSYWPRLQTFSWPLAGLVLLLPVVPFARNWADNEQRGHDFGYQFGYLMFKPGGGYPEMDRDAVLYGGTDPGRFVPTYMILVESLAPPRAKTALPKYPQSRTFDRSDVYIITQNALADGTYMSYIRDHYDYSRPDLANPSTLTNRPSWQRRVFELGCKYLGRATTYPREPIWIPSESDSARAFSMYVDDLRTRQPMAGEDVRVEGGRVSVQGVAGVMSINGILTKMIFDHNKDKHSFYVEESYVIPWMYPYMEPFGIILKINKEPLPHLDAAVLERDRKYWDALTEDFKSNPRFHRDDVAQKTFSKARSAIGGLYAERAKMARQSGDEAAAQRLTEEAEYAFLQGVALCPDSPEANFRLAQLYLERGRLADATALLETFQQRDPYNGKIREAINSLRDLKQQTSQLQELERQYAAQPDNPQIVSELIRAYAARQQIDQLNNLVNTLLARPGLSAHDHLRLAQMYAQINQRDRVRDLITLLSERFPQPELSAEDLLLLAQLFALCERLDKVQEVILYMTKRYPQHALGWYNLAAIYSVQNKCDEAAAALQHAFAGDTPDRKMLNTARQDPRFEPCRNSARMKSVLADQITSALPGGMPAKP
jgi:tetratricopeptide (TPR) repeat protein